MFKRGSTLSDQDAGRFLRKLIIEGFISEQLVLSQHHTVITYVALGAKGAAFLANPDSQKIYFHVSLNAKMQNRRLSSISADGTGVQDELNAMHMNAVSEAAALKEK